MDYLYDFVQYGHLWALAGCLTLAYILYMRYGGGISSVPGPWVASITDLWRASAVSRGQFHLVNRKLHEQYGPLVRIGPRCVSVGDSREVSTIYSIRNVFAKSRYYHVPRVIVNGQLVSGLFALTDERLHSRAKRPVAHAYAMSTLKDYEHLVDRTSIFFLKRLDELFAETGKECDLGEWLQWYAFDVIGEITFSRRLGFLEQGSDVNDMISILKAAGWYTAVLGQIPWLDYLLTKNWLATRLFPRRKGMAIVQFVSTFVESRLTAEKTTHTTREQHDFLSKFLAAAQDHAKNIPSSFYLGWSMSNINAGSDTTAISLRAIFYYLMKTPHALCKLRNELNNTTLSSVPQWNETSGLQYLDAVVKEALRLHTPVGLILERVVPQDGTTICGRPFQRGTIVGCNPYVVAHDSSIYGKQYDVDEFWPERWLEADESTRSEMDRCSLVFGGGKRTCIGRNISLLEIKKLVPLLLLRYEISFSEARKPWSVWNSFFVHQAGFKVILKKYGTSDPGSRAR